MSLGKNLSQILKEQEVSDSKLNKLLKFEYEDNFIPSQEFLENMPDLQNGESIKGARVGIERVGISNFRLPLKIKTRDSQTQELECSIIGTVSLEGVQKGINMSRILRSFYDFQDHIFDIEKVGEVLKHYQKTIGAFEAHILINFNYRIWQESLRSVDKQGNKNGGWQYYKIALESKINAQGEYVKLIHFDFVYSSACPCSTELSLYNMEERGRYSIPHSQRSISRISVQFDDMIWIEDLQELCKRALKTEVLVFCKREDELSFAELNAANVKFVEDAIRLLYQELIQDIRIKDFKIIASHNESLHGHDAIAVSIKGIEGGFTQDVTKAEFQSLIY